MTSFNKPLAARVGVEHVSIAQGPSGLWSVMAWAVGTCPRMIHGPRAYKAAATLAKEYAHKVCGILELPDETSLIHVRNDGSSFRVDHEGRSGNSFATLGRFDDRDEAVRFAISELGTYAPCRLGEVASCFL